MIYLGPTPKKWAFEFYRNFQKADGKQKNGGGDGGSKKKGGVLEESRL